MLSIILRRDDEPTVVHMTQEILQRELRNLNGSEILLEDDWANGVFKARNDFVCLVEPDCLVSSGYFDSLIGLFRKNHEYSKLAMMSSSVGVNNWANRFYGYELAREKKDFDVTEKSSIESVTSTVIQPLDRQKSKSPFPVQVGFIPGAIIRTAFLRKTLEEDENLLRGDIANLSTDVSFTFWNSDRRIYVNPNSTYVSTAANLLETRGLRDVGPLESTVATFRREGV